MKLKEVSALINGHLKGDSELEINGVNSLYRASKNHLAYVLPGLGQVELKKIKAGALILKLGTTLNYVNEIYVEDPRMAFKTLLEYFYPRQRFFTKISDLARIEAGVKLGEGVSVGHFSWIGSGSEIGAETEIHCHVAVYPGVKIGKNCLIYSHVVIYPGTEIGSEVIIHSGAVIGADGFGYLRNSQGELEKIPQVGRVIIADHCEIGANSCVDRAALEETRLEKNVKLDNLVQIGHNVQIGANSTISAQSGIGGSTKIGSNVVFGGQVGVADHISVTDGVSAAGQCGITSTIKEKGIVVAGMPAQEIRAWRKNAVLSMNMEKIVERLRNVEKEIKELKRGGNDES